MRGSAATLTPQKLTSTMANIATQGTRPFPIEIPEGYTLAKCPWVDPFTNIMAFGMCRKYGTKPPTLTQWRGLLRKMRFTQKRLEEVSNLLSAHFTEGLSFDQWAEVIEELAAANQVAKYPLPR